MGVSKEYRRKGYAKILIKKFENTCKKKNIIHIDLGARFRACPLYIEMGYKPSLMIQVFDFATIQDIRKANTFNLKETSSWQGDTYGFIFYNIPKVDEKYIDVFEKNVSTAHARFIFEKDL
ncbi:MAG: GNAT family N-acetyltransferase [bacterium]|nr:GNAT family N-acetyltransferase [bacterium]